MTYEDCSHTFAFAWSCALSMKLWPLHENIVDWDTTFIKSHDCKRYVEYCRIVANVLMWRLSWRKKTAALKNRTENWGVEACPPNSCSVTSYPVRLGLRSLYCDLKSSRQLLLTEAWVEDCLKSVKLQVVLQTHLIGYCYKILYVLL